MKNSALITGAAKRIGREVALDLASRGYDIAFSYNKSKQEALDLACEIREKYKVKCEIFHADLQEKKQAKDLIDKALSQFPNLNLLINNASVFNESDFFSDEGEIEENFALHFFSPLVLSRAFAKNVREKNIQNAQIINMVDKNIARYETRCFYYLLSKKLLSEFTKMLALQISPEVRVNAIAPGLMLEDTNPKKSPEFIEKIINKIPLKRKGEPENILQAINFLTENDFINGQILFIDGGASLNHAG